MTCLRPVSSSDSLHTNPRHTSTSSGKELPELYNFAIPRIPRTRLDELQSLLADSSDNERGEMLSLHSNPAGRGRRGMKTEVQGGCEWDTSEDNVIRV